MIGLVIFCCCSLTVLTRPTCYSCIPLVQ